MPDVTPPLAECYCGRTLRKIGFGWQHAEGDPVYCYPEESGLDDESRCMADLDPDSEVKSDA